MSRDFTSEELMALDLLHKAHPIHYGKIILEVSFEGGVFDSDESRRRLFLRLWSAIHAES